MTVKIVSHVEDHGYFPIVKGKQLFVGLTHDGMTKSFLVDHDRYPSASAQYLDTRGVSITDEFRWVRSATLQEGIDLYGTFGS